MRHRIWQLANSWSGFLVIRCRHSYCLSGNSGGNEPRWLPLSALARWGWNAPSCAMARGSPWFGAALARCVLLSLAPRRLRTFWGPYLLADPSPGISLPASSSSRNAFVCAGCAGEHMSAASRAFELRVGVAVDGQVAAVGETGHQADEQAATLPQAPARAT